MENNENLVTEVTENVETPTEQTPKTYTQEEVDAIVGKRIARKEAKIRKEYDRTYGHLENVLKAATGKENVEELAETYEEYYRGKGVKIPERENTRDIEVLARADAEEIISGGYEEVVEETERLMKKGLDKMTAREKIVFQTLATHRQNTERGNELSSMGVTEDVYNSKEFKDFASKFNANTPIKEIYDIYSKTQPKKEHKIMGSMKSSVSEDSTVKDFYTYEEASRIPRSELDKNPKLFKAIENSMLKW